MIPVLIYPDPSAAADWLGKAFGFTIRLRIANHRIQMKAGEGCFTIAEGNVPPNNSHIIQVRIEDANGHCERARQNGAIILTEPQDHPYGERQYNAQDFYGHRWDFTETITDVAPEEWSGGHFMLSIPDRGGTWRFRALTLVPAGARAESSFALNHRAAAAARLPKTISGSSIRAQLRHVLCASGLRVARRGQPGGVCTSLQLDPTAGGGCSTCYRHASLSPADHLME